MKKQQLILVGSALLLLIALFFFGNTIPPNKAVSAVDNKPNPEKKIETENQCSLLATGKY